MAGFDIEGAKAAGYTDAEIRQAILASTAAGEARSAGYGDADILGHFGLASGQDTSALRLPKIAVSGFARGLATLAGVPGSLEAFGNAHLPEFLTKRLDGKPGPANNLFPTIADTVGLTNSLGLTNRPELQPEGAEKLLDAAAAGAGGAPFGPMGLAAGAAGGVGAEIGHSLAPESAIAPLVGGLAGGLGVAGLERSLAPRIAAAAHGRAVAGAEKTLAGLPAARAAVWDPVESAVGAASPVGLKDFTTSLVKLGPKAGTIPGLLAMIGPVMPKTWAEGRMIRDSLDSMLSAGTIPAAARADAEALRDALHRDLKTAAGKAGVSKLWDQAETGLADLGKKETAAQTAAAALPPPAPAPLRSMPGFLGNIGSNAFLGQMIEQGLTQAFGIPQTGAGILFGAFAPAILSGVKTGVANPTLMRLPAAGVAGANALTTGQQ